MTTDPKWGLVVKAYGLTTKASMRDVEKRVSDVVGKKLTFNIDEGKTPKAGVTVVRYADAVELFLSKNFSGEEIAKVVGQDISGFQIYNMESGGFYLCHRGEGEIEYVRRGTGHVRKFK